MLSSKREVVTVKPAKARKSRGLIQAVALLGLSTAGATALLGHNSTPTSNQAAAANGSTSGTSSQSSSGSTSSSTGTKTATSDAIGYRYGTVQLKVTQVNGKLTAVDLVQASATAGRDGAFSYLVTDAITANGASFSNLSGATFTTDAFKQALSNAISKL